MLQNDVKLQREYYSQTALNYDQMHPTNSWEAALGLAFFEGALNFLNVESILEVGSGTGAVLIHLKERYPQKKIVGIEPVKELRKIGHQKGLKTADLISGDACCLPFPDNHFDVVCEFAVFHHVKHPRRAVSEMLRVAKKVVFFADSNNFGQGGLISRSIKQGLHFLGLWKYFNFIKTGFKGYSVSKGDGLSYSFSLFDYFKQISQACQKVHLLDLGGAGDNPYRTSASIALLGVKSFEEH